MDPEIAKKVDKIFAIVSDIKTDVAVIKANDVHTEKRITDIGKKMFVMDVDIQALNTKKTEYNLIGKGIVILTGLLGSATGALVVIIINHYWK